MTDTRSSVLVTLRPTPNAVANEDASSSSLGSQATVDSELEHLINDLEDQIEGRVGVQLPPAGLSFAWPDQSLHGPAVQVRVLAEVSAQGRVHVLDVRTSREIPKEFLDAIRLGVLQAPFVPGQLRGEPADSVVCLALDVDLTAFAAQVSIVRERQSDRGRTCLGR